MYGIQYVGIGKIRYSGKRALNDYDLRLTFVLYSDANDSFTITDPLPIFRNAFGSWLEQLPWEPGHEMPFKIEEGLSKSDILYPIKRVEVVYQIKASDPFGHSYDEKLATYDITESWLGSQHRLKSAVRQKKKYSVETPVVEKHVPETETSGRYDQKAIYDQKAKYGEAKQHVVAEEVKK